jgi:hypothetical protein
MCAEWVRLTCSFKLLDILAHRFFRFLLAHRIDFAYSRYHVVRLSTQAGAIPKTLSIFITHNDIFHSRFGTASGPHHVFAHLKRYPRQKRRTSTRLVARRPASVY